LGSEKTAICRLPLPRTAFKAFEKVAQNVAQSGNITVGSILTGSDTFFLCKKNIVDGTNKTNKE